MNPHIAQGNSSGPDLSPGQASQVVHILEGYLAELEQGGQPHPDALIARHPEHAEALRAYLEKLDLLHQVATGLRGSAPARGTLPACLASPPDPLGDFRIRREVGRGGMGVVYEAEQASLGRRVALKVLPRQVSSDLKTLARFRREARSAAQLHHTNIVPVFEVGKEGEVSYYAMQFIQGQGLDLVIDELRRLKDRAHRTGPAREPEPPDLPIPSGPTAAAPSRSRQVSRMAQSLLTGRFVP